MSEEPSSQANLALYQSLQTKSIELSHQLADHVVSIQHQMKHMSQSTAEAGKVYKLSVKNLSEEIDASTKMSIELITHCDELDKDLSQLQELSRQIKSVDKALDQLKKALM
ncbi:uncharacterized protein EV154DRAFT_434098 [Mucor mucedo]|uniref:uncharacterized protein n=1 Tax=Mucor mucedo TaxID=29922 RepID=UPI00221F25BF|nr:uncharacterized protein EV154DRAFT_434098 [Mucor mucedo]KAI7897144.1 hypothetical protein EV154DRAFT_434098 [Mucor mucedo]